MPVHVLRGEEKIAMVLMGLPPAATEGVLAQLGRPNADRLRAEIGRFSMSPPAAESVEQVLREFQDLLERADREATSWQPRIAPGTIPPSDDAERSTNSADDDATMNDGSLNSSDDPLAELREIDSARLAVALADEHPSTSALILNCLDSEKAGEVLKRLPAEPRRNAFIWLRHGSAGSPEMVPHIVRAVVQKSRSVSDAATGTGNAKYKKMAEMLRSLERTDRMEVLAALEQQDSDTAAKVKELLYTFEDLLLIENRSMQKLLAEIDAKTLALSLKEAAPEIAEKVMGNVSKRAREGLTEEISFLGTVPAAELERAQKAIVEVIQRLDQAGELMMTQ